MSDDLDFEIMKNESLASSGNDDRAYETTDSGNKESRRSRSSSVRLLDYGPIDVAVPNEWEVRPLSEKYDLARGVNYSSAHYCEPGEGLSFYTLNSVAKGGGLKKNSIKYYDEEKVNDQKTARNRDILIANTDLSQDGEIIGYPVLIPEDEKKASFSHHLTKLVGGDGVNTRYLSYLLQSDFVHRRMIAFSCGSTVLNLNSDLLRGLDLAFPPLPEQRKIASVLYTVDQAIQKTEAIIEQAKRVKRGLMQDLFGKADNSHSGRGRKELWIGPKKFEVPEHWEKTKIQEIGRVVTGDTPSTDDEKNFGGSLPFVTPSDLKQTKYVAETDRTLSAQGRGQAKPVPEGSVMMDCIGSDMGKVAIAGREVATNQQINSVVVTDDEYNAEFLYYHLLVLSGYIKAQAGRTATPIVNKGDFQTFGLLKPPLEEQQRIAESLATYDEVDSTNRGYCERLKSLKKGLMQDLLTGEVRTADKAIEVLDEVAAYG